MPQIFSFSIYKLEVILYFIEHKIQTEYEMQHYLHATKKKKKVTCHTPHTGEVFNGSSPNKARTSRVNFSVLGFYRETGYVERFVLLVELSHVFMETEKSHDVLFVSGYPGRSARQFSASPNT